MIKRERIMESINCEENYEEKGFILVFYIYKKDKVLYLGLEW